MPPDASIWRDVDARPPSASERRLLTVLVTAVAEPLLDEQVATVLVDGVCRCGHDVDVVLHVVHGRVHELEVLDTVEGEGAAVDTAALSDPAGPTVA